MITMNNVPVHLAKSQRMIFMNDVPAHLAKMGRGMHHIASHGAQRTKQLVFPTIYHPLMHPCPPFCALSTGLLQSVAADGQAPRKVSIETEPWFNMESAWVQVGRA
eukprot:scaffold314547_cov19-Tisochrysis_lutea.AAC.1